MTACWGGQSTPEDKPSDTSPAVTDSGEGLDTGENPDTGKDSGKDTGVDTGTPKDPAWQVPFNEVIVGGTHNSYSPERGTLRGQLGDGIRCLELDIHDNDYSSSGGYRLGHASPGDEVADSENGIGLLLPEWLDVVNDWSGDHPEHVPITVVLDIKDNLTDNEDANQGNLGALNEQIRKAFGSRLLSPGDLPGGSWPVVESLRGRVLVQLSGDSTSRMRYVRDTGFRPAVAMNDKGQVIEVHDSGSGTLWYWTGQMMGDGQVRWMHHGKFDTGMDPAVGLTSDGWIVEVHKSESKDHLWAHAGQLDADYRVVWSDSQKFESSGSEPSLAQVSDSLFSEINTNTSGSGGREAWTISLNRQKAELEFSADGQTSTSRYDEAQASSSAGSIWVGAYSDHESVGFDTLMYGTDGLNEGRIRYEQVAFVDYQPYNANELLSANLKFFNVKSGGMSEAQEWLNDGWLVRMWGFSSGDVQTSLRQPTCPATDEPGAIWYNTYLRDVGALE